MSIIQFMHLICVHFWAYIDITRWLITLLRFRVNDASQRKKCFGVIRTDVCRSVGITVNESKTYSDRVCNPCARKIRNLGNLYQSIQRAFKLSESSESKENLSPSSGAQQSKRLLNSPAGKSPCRKAVCVTCPTAFGKVSLGPVVQPGTYPKLLANKEREVLASVQQVGQGSGSA